jgi:hypothetical protein
LSIDLKASSNKEFYNLSLSKLDSPPQHFPRNLGTGIKKCYESGVASGYYIHRGA